MAMRDFNVIFGFALPPHPTAIPREPFINHNVAQFTNSQTLSHLKRDVERFRTIIDIVIDIIEKIEAHTPSV